MMKGTQQKIRLITLITHELGKKIFCKLTSSTFIKDDQNHPPNILDETASRSPRLTHATNCNSRNHFGGELANA